MKFDYKKYGPGLIRPVIPVELKHNNLTIPYEALVDSGADFCIFDVQIANILGINVESGKRGLVSGITGVSETIYFHKITLNVGGWPYDTEVAFGNLGRYGHGIVGQLGFFDRYVVKFDFVKEDIELKERKK